MVAEISTNETEDLIIIGDITTGNIELNAYLDYRGPKGERGEKGEQGEKGEKGDTGAKGNPGDDGITPTIGENGNWYLGSTDTGKPSRGIQGEKGDTGDIGPQGPKGDQGIQGNPGDDGITPTIGENGNWYLGSTDTGKPSRGIQGEKGDTGDIGPQGPKGKDGIGVTILGSYASIEELIENHPAGNLGDSYLVDGYLYVWNAINLNWNNVGRIQGPKGDIGPQGPKGDQGMQGNPGTDGITPTIGENGNWYLGSTDTGKPSRGIQGEKGDTGDIGPEGPKGDQGIQGNPGTDGITPTIGENGNWYLGSTDTGKPSRGVQGEMPDLSDYCTKSDLNNEVQNLDKSIGKVSVNVGDVSFLATKNKTTVGAINEIKKTSDDLVSGSYYSTDEVKTNKIWIDGKPIYRKVVDCGDAPNKTSKYIDHNISDLSNIVKITGFLTNGTEWFPLPRLHPTSSYSISVQANTTQILLYDQYDFSNYQTYVIIEYTKTTD